MADQTLGRLGAKVAKLLRGKYKPNFTPHVDCGDNVIIINADKVKLTGNKWNDRVYLSYTGYPGGQREMTPARLIAKPNGEERLLKKVVKGMLPKNILGAKLLNNLYVYAGSEHKQAAQNPFPLNNFATFAPRRPSVWSVASTITHSLVTVALLAEMVL